VTGTGRRCLFALTCTLACPSTAAAQAASQVWANGIVNWFATDLMTFQVDGEPKSNPLDVDVTPRVQYTLAPWIDALAELDFDHTADKDSTWTPRVGVELHILSRLLDRHAAQRASREKPPRRRLIVSTLLRVEDDQSTWRFRDRFALVYALNRRKTTDDGAIYLTADNELFVPFDRAPGAALVSKMRFRGGLGYRDSFAWRYELLYIWNGTRNGGSGPLVEESRAIDIRVIRAF
jgi:Protein of unknown function (DUF2490)